MDLLIGSLVMVLLSLLTCWSSYHISRRLPNAAAVFTAITVVSFTILFAILLHGKLSLARFIPLSNVIVLGNWIPLGLSSLAGIVCANRTLPVLRRGVVTVCLFSLATYALLQPLFPSPDVAQDIWTADGVAQQSNNTNCVPCAAATLLRHYKIESGEEELVRLCLTGRKGTLQLGLYRGLKLKTKDTRWQVKPFHSTIDQLSRANKFPALLFVKLEKGADVDPRYANEWGWIPGVGHAVVIYGFNEAGFVEIGDPGIGRELWTVQNLRVLWQGEGVRLE